MKVTSTSETLAVTNADRPVRPQENPARDTAAAVTGVQPQTNRTELEVVVEKMNDAAVIFDKSLQFKVLDGNRIIVKIIDTASGEVLKEIPPEKLVEAFRSMEKFMGLLVDRKV